MYEKLLKQLEEQLVYNKNFNIEEDSKIADLIIKIKTIQALDTSAELIADSRQALRN